MTDDAHWLLLRDSSVVEYGLMSTCVLTLALTEDKQLTARALDALVTPASWVWDPCVIKAEKTLELKPNISAAPSPLENKQIFWQKLQPGLCSDNYCHFKNLDVHNWSLT